MKQTLYEKLARYGEEGFYPFHMPGHKRNTDFFRKGSVDFAGDITEIQGFDNLHHPQGVIREAQERAAALFGAVDTFFSVNGSTGAILSAISAACKKRGRILIARNCHKAVYHAAYLRELSIDYLYPKWEETKGLAGGISPEEVKAALSAHPDTQAVALTSPTYDGVLSDIQRIAKIVHGAGALLIVDEAHGAHLSFHQEFPASAVSLGADLVIQSIHKTLPSPTQTGLLHRTSRRVSREDLARFMEIYQTSSPSYPLMAGMDACICRLEQEGEALFEAYAKRLFACRKELSLLKHICLAGDEIVGDEEIFDYDPTKLYFSVKNCSLKGNELAQILRNKYRLELEMESPGGVLALSSVADTKEGFARLSKALKEIDGSLKKQDSREKGTFSGAYVPMEQVMGLSQAMDGKKSRCALALSEGKISGEFAYLYPPGIPLIVPGERITGKFVNDLFACQREGLSLQGLSDYSNQSICVVEEKN